MLTFVHDLKITTNSLTERVILVSPNGIITDFFPGTLKFLSRFFS